MVVLAWIILILLALLALGVGALVIFTARTARQVDQARRRSLYCATGMTHVLLRVVSALALGLSLEACRKRKRAFILPASVCP